MTRPLLEVADIVRAQGDRFIHSNFRWFHWAHRKVLRAIARCRTAVLGGHRDQCPRCGYRTTSYNSCRNRHCPKCQSGARDKWIMARQSELLSVPYVHVVLTLPHQLSPLALQNKKVLFDLLFRASAETLQEVARDPHQVLGYLARYTHRVAITNHRLVAFEHDQVTFRWKDYAHGNKKRMMTLDSQEFLRRFLLHVLPRGLVRIRSFGFLANRRRATLLPLCQRLLADQPMPHPSADTTSPTQPTCFRCPKCSTPMLIVERFSVTTAWQLSTRSAYLDSS